MKLNAFATSGTSPGKKPASNPARSLPTAARRQAPSSLGIDGRFARKLRLARRGSVRVAPTLPGGGIQFDDLAGRHARPGEYLGGSDIPEPEMTASEYFDMTPDEITAFVRRCVQADDFASRAELRDAIRDDQRRGVGSGSHARDRITRDHEPDLGAQVRIGRHRYAPVGAYREPFAIQQTLNKPVPQKIVKAQEKAQELARRKALYGPIHADAVARGAPPRQMEAFRLLAVEGLTQAEAARRMGISEKNVSKLFDKSRSYTRVRPAKVGGKTSTHV